LARKKSNGLSRTGREGWEKRSQLGGERKRRGKKLAAKARASSGRGKTTSEEMILVAID